jgi:hypothetical protein
VNDIHVKETAMLRRHDLWAAPPGGSPHGIRWSDVRGWIALFLVVSLALGGGVTLASMRTSTAVSAQDALAEFQAAGGDHTARPRGDDQSPRRRSRAQVSSHKTEERAEADRTSAAAPLSSSQPRSRQGAHEGSPARRDEAVQGSTSTGRPAEGVYAWTVDGYEQAPGVRRQLPERSHRVITHAGGDGWQEHHIFSEEREQWMNLSSSSEGVTATSVRNRVVMGPVEQDKTVTYDPPVFVARFPTKLGDSWHGSWSGRTSGTYTAKVFEHTTITIDGENVEVYATEVVMEMRGEIEGTATTRSWYSPEHGLVVKQGQEMRITSGPSDYRSEWIGQVVSLDPQT